MPSARNAATTLGWMAAILAVFFMGTSYLARHYAVMPTPNFSKNAGLRLLSEVDFDIIKIDLSLVRAGARHEPSEAVLRALQEMARQRNQTVVAEGVETPELLESVLELGFEYGQGYLLGRPAPSLEAPTLALLDLMTGKVPETESAA